MGELMDLIIDYLNYVFVPAFALFKSGLLPGWTGWVAIIIITFASAMYFADTRMKTKDNSFCGFPACWNITVLVIFALEPNFWASLTAVAALTAAMFMPVKFIHPIRTIRWRILSLTMLIAWIVFAVLSAWEDFDPGKAVHTGLVITTIYLLFAGIVQQIIPEKTAKS